jgi:hypothetical protein
MGDWNSLYAIPQRRVLYITMAATTSPMATTISRAILTPAAIRLARSR